MSTREAVLEMTDSIPKLERVLERSIKAFLPGLLRMDRFASEISAVTRVIVILEQRQNNNHDYTVMIFVVLFYFGVVVFFQINYVIDYVKN